MEFEKVYSLPRGFIFYSKSLYLIYSSMYNWKSGENETGLYALRYLFVQIFHNIMKTFIQQNKLKKIVFEMHIRAYFS